VRYEVLSCWGRVQCPSLVQYVVLKILYFKIYTGVPLANILNMKIKIIVTMKKLKLQNLYFILFFHHVAMASDESPQVSMIATSTDRARRGKYVII